MDAHLQFEALADPTRRTIFETLTRGPLSVGHLAADLPVTRPAVSQHLKVLTGAGLVTAEQRGTRRVYSVSTEGLEAMSQRLASYWTDVIDRYAHAAREEHAMTNPHTDIPPVIKTRVVQLGIEDAFALFTERLDTWWPLASFSIGSDNDEQPPTSVRFEGCVGGRVVEVGVGGEEHVWADVIAWQPPRRFVLAWHPTRHPTAASILEVRFSATDGGTELRLEHRGWEEFGEGGTDRRDAYVGGWDVVLQPYEDAATESAPATP